MFFSQLSFYESPNRENIIMKSRDLFEDFNDIMWPKTYEHISRESKKYLEYQQYHLDYDVAHELDFKNNTRNRMSVKERIESLEKDFSEFDQGFKNFFETADIKKFEYTQTSSLRQATNLVLQYFNSYIGDRDYRFYISSEGQEESNLFDCEGECNSLPGTDDNVTCSVKVGNRTFTKKFVFDDICD